MGWLGLAQMMRIMRQDYNPIKRREVKGGEEREEENSGARREYDTGNWSSSRGRPGKKDQGDHLIKVSVRGWETGNMGGHPKTEGGWQFLFFSSSSHVRIDDHRKRGAMISVGKRRNLWCIIKMTPHKCRLYSNSNSFCMSEFSHILASCEYFWGHFILRMKCYTTLYLASMCVHRPAGTNYLAIINSAYVR